MTTTTGRPDAIAMELARNNSFGLSGAYGNALEHMTAALTPWVAGKINLYRGDQLLPGVVAELIAQAMLLQHEADTGKQADAIVALHGEDGSEADESWTVELEASLAAHRGVAALRKLL